MIPERREADGEPRWPRFAAPLAVAAFALAIAFTGLGRTSLWDDDEGVNAECTREMMEAGTWIIPTFNWDLRTAKPILLYWIMRGSFGLFGVGEFGARFPSAIAFVLTSLVVYDLARRMFGDRWLAAIAGFIAASSLQLVILGHAATTDALHIAFTVLYIRSFWIGTQQPGPGWMIPCAFWSALMMLTKGPAVGLILPSGAIGLTLLWNGELRRLLHRRMIGAVAVWSLVALPWYILVGTETKGEWLKAFFLNENLARASEPKERHGGIPVLYEFVCIALLFAPWSAFLYVSMRSAIRTALVKNGSAERLLLGWMAVYVVAFSVAATKLPHYIAPVYPALAIVVARFLAGWQAGRETVAIGWLRAAAIGFALTGLATVAVCVIGSGATALPIKNQRVFPALSAYWWIGLLPISAAAAMEWSLQRDLRRTYVIAALAGALGFALTLAAFVPQALEERKAIEVLVERSGARDLDREVRIASYDYPYPSLTFYVARRVERLADGDAAAEFLAFPIPSYLFVTEEKWECEVKPKVRRPVRILAERYDYQRHQTILVVGGG